MIIISFFFFIFYLLWFGRGVAFSSSLYELYQKTNKIDQEDLSACLAGRFLPNAASIVVEPGRADDLYLSSRREGINQAEKKCWDINNNINK